MLGILIKRVSAFRYRGARIFAKSSPYITLACNFFPRFGLTFLQITVYYTPPLFSCSGNDSAYEHRGDRSRGRHKERTVPNKVALFILDGYGEAPKSKGNAVSIAKTPFLDSIRGKYPWKTIKTSGEAVGLPAGQMGNSEVGHLNLGAGRVVYQSLTKVTKSIKDGDFFTNKVLLDGIENCKKHDSALHLIGLVSDGGVHSHLDHIDAFLKLAKENGLTKVFVHANLDGRDVPPRSAIPYLERLETKMAELGIGKIATVGGRYYGMDRDKRWERVEKAYNAYVLGEGELVGSAVEAVERSYTVADNDDEFCLPSVVVDGDSNPVGTIADNDTVIYFNFRPDRARQMTRAIADPAFDGFERKKQVAVHYITLTQYDETFPYPIAYPPEKLTNILAQVLADNKIPQLRIAETEKYAHVTFFFNGQVEEPYPYEERVLIDSPKVATYDMQPEMSAPLVTDALEKEIASKKHNVIICNYANCDMVGHTGVIEAAVKAVEAVDECLSRVVPKILAEGGEVMITADHGNADEMLIDGKVSTQHSTNDVPFIMVSDKAEYTLREDGSLCDVAPTILKLLGVAQPDEMTGSPLIMK